MLSGPAWARAAEPATIRSAKPAKQAINGLHDARCARIMSDSSRVAVYSAFAVFCDRAVQRFEFAVSDRLIKLLACLHMLDEIVGAAVARQRLVEQMVSLGGDPERAHRPDHDLKSHG